MFFMFISGNAALRQIVLEKQFSELCPKTIKFGPYYCGLLLTCVTTQQSFTRENNNSV